ncbi:Histone-lysine N-methyltransferase SETMAR [Habropoda laboriosa]|uniref:Histone-lysine N-methyltransferase SETMAR n=1 Tax=Habropoda laboriosa TaxID=597456 RepID=A0A0L7RHI1_9HYME|nr:Histone-lysine N-methyltransferase SETMAR [Habropoda laboriosa]
MKFYHILFYSLVLFSIEYHFFKHLNNFITNKLFRNEDTVKAAFKEFFHSKTNDFYILETMKPFNR